MSLGHGASIVRSGLVLHLDAANRKSYTGSGTAWNDMSGIGNNGTLVNGPTYISSNGGILTLDGTNNYISVSSISSGQFASGFTWAGWCRTSAFGAGWMWPFGTTTGSWLQLGKVSGSGNIRFDGASLLYSGGALDANVNIADNIWHYMVGVWDTQFRYIYLDGTLRASVASVLGANPSAYGTMLLGAHPGPSEFWNGSFGPMSIYTRALSATEIKQNFDATRGRYGI
jgi:hypothetical protein